MELKKIIHLSDTHFSHRRVKIPNGDLIIHSGDACLRGNIQEFIQFARWFRELPHETKIFVPGNHDLIVEEDPTFCRGELGSGVHMLINESFQWYDKLIYGSPITPFFNNWAYMLFRGPVIAECWAKIPDHTDVLITHGPPYGILDEVYIGIEPHAGCMDLLERVQQVNPELHLFGHIHEGRGHKKIDKTRFYNSAIMNDTYLPEFDPVEIEIMVNPEETK